MPEPDTLKRGDEINKRAQEMFDLENSEQEFGNDPYANSGIDQLEADLREKAKQASWKTDVQGQANEAVDKNEIFDKSWGNKLFGKAKKSGPLGLIAAAILAGGTMVGFLGPATMIINLMENLADTNDSSSTAMERRFMRVLKNTVESDVCKSKKVKCKMNRMSNHSLRKLERKGVKACYKNQKSPCDGTKKRTGYASSKPTHYEIEVDGKVKRIAAKDLTGFLSQKENRKYARKVFGVGGAINLRFKAWAGKHITNKFYKKFNLQRNGGLADGKNNKKMTPAERAKAAIDKVRGKIPTNEPDAGKIRADVEKRVGRAKKGGPIYTASVVGCLGVKVPRLIVVSVVAVQIAQILPIIMDVALSSGGKFKASEATAEDADTIGTMLTETTPRKSDGKKTSALDSAYLLSAMGINTNKPPASSYAPGFGVMSLDYIQEGIKKEKQTQEACDIALSSEAMYTAAALTAATTTNPIGYLIKLGAGLVVGELVKKIVGDALEKQIKKVFTHYAKNNNIPKARGEALGDVLGIGAAAFFAGGGMSRMLPGLKKSQVKSYNQVKQENEQFNREMDIAALSPLDTSSKYTFLGSMVHNMKTAAMVNSSRNGGMTLGSILLGAGSLPNYAFAAPGASATDFSDVDYERYCDYAEDFGISDDVAINMAGMPCTGITAQQASMSTETAVHLMTDVEKWVDNTKDTPDDATIDELIDEGVIKKDTPLYDYIDQCSNPDTGEYLINSAGCTIDCVGDCKKSVSGSRDGQCQSRVNENGETERTCASDLDGYEESSVENVKDSRSLAAIPVFLLDYQIMQSMNGEDEEPDETSSSNGTSNNDGGATFTGDLAWPVNKKFWDSNSSIFKKAHNSCGTFTGGGCIDIGLSKGTPVYAMAAGSVTKRPLGRSSYKCTGDPNSSNNGGLMIESQVNGKTLKIAYAHGYDVTGEDSVKTGDLIMKLGEVGNACGAHLHMDMTYGDKPICPQDVFIAMGNGNNPNFEELTKKTIGTCGR